MDITRGPLKMTVAMNHLSMTAKSILNDAKVFSQDANTLDRAIFALVHWIDLELNHGAVLTAEQQNVIRQVRHNVSLLLAKGLVSFQTPENKSAVVDQESYQFEPITSNCNVLKMHHLADALMSI